jgi:hypothetical protein
MNDFWCSGVVALAWPCFVIPLKSEVYPNITYKFTSCLTENIAFFRRSSWLKLFVLRIMRNMEKHCVGKSRVSNVAACGTCSYHWVLKGELTVVVVSDGTEQSGDLGKLGTCHCIVTWVLMVEDLLNLAITSVKTESVWVNTERQ